MKKFIYILILLSTFSCRDNEIIFEGPYHVRFTESEGSEKESFSEIIPLSVHLVAPHQNEDIIIHYSISGNAREGKDYEILGTKGEVEIPKGKSFGYIELSLINNSNNILSSQDIIFTLDYVENSEMEVGFGSGIRIGKEMTFTIYDDCILSGNYVGKLDGLEEKFEDITISSNDCIEYRLSNWDLNLFNFQEERDLYFLDNGDNTLTIPVQEEETLATDQATISGYGVVNPVSREITFILQLIDFEGSPEITLKYNLQ